MRIGDRDAPVLPSRPRAIARRSTRSIAAVVLIAFVAVLSASCIGTTPSGQELPSNKGPRNPPNREFLGGAVAANNAFAADLYRSVATGPGNFVYSPYALYTVLAMARAGSDPSSETRRRMDALLHAELAPNIDSGLNTIDQTLAGRTGEKRSDMSIGKVSVEFAEAVWGQRGTHFKDDYLNLLVGNYGSGVHIIDFKSDAEAARQAINHWASDATKGRIEELATRGDVSQHTQLLLAAESYLQAPWQVPFDATKTTRATFTRVDDQPEDVRMMQLTAATGFRFASNSLWSAVEVPYLGNELVLDLIEPTPGQFESFEQQFNAELLNQVVTALKPQAVDLRVPQFQFETAANLTEPLKASTPKTFEDAEFAGITSDEMLSISDVVWKGFFGIDEQGTNAENTATAQPSSQPAVAGAITVSIDRPFAFMVRDRETGTVLTIGRVMNPR